THDLDVGGCGRLDDRLRQSGKPVDGARDATLSRDRCPAGHGRGARTHGADVVDGKSAAFRVWGHCRCGSRLWVAAMDSKPPAAFLPARRVEREYGWPGPAISHCGHAVHLHRGWIGA